MKVTSSTRFPTSSGGIQEIAIELDASEIESTVENWGLLNLTDRWRHLSCRADVLVVEYLARNEHISVDRAQERINDIMRTF